MTKTIADLSPTDLENLTYDLVQSLGLKNAVWRTPGRDGGRDIQGEWFTEDLSGHVGCQVWYVECKRYESSVSWPLVWEKISYAESNSADVLLFAVSSSLSPQAVDEVNKWNAQRKKPVIRFWNGVDIETKLRLFPVIAIKYGLSLDPRIEAGGALLPVVNILLKYSNAAHSADEFGMPTQTKHVTLYSLSELISARLEEVEKNGTFLTSPFRDGFDGFEWLDNTIALEEKRVDRYAFRAITCYLLDLLGVNNIKLHSEDGALYYSLPNEIPEYVLNDLFQISLLSNFELSQTDNRLEIRVR